MHLQHNRCSKVRLFFAFLYLAVAFTASSAWSEEPRIEKQMSRSFVKSRQVIRQIRQKREKGQAVKDDVARLKAISESLSVMNKSLDERVEEDREKIEALGGKALQRRNEMLERRKATIDAYIEGVRKLDPDGAGSNSTFDTLENLLDEIGGEENRPLFGAMPYTRFDYARKAPVSIPTVIPAYKGGSKTPKTADLSPSPEAPITKEIAELAKSLNWSPAAIYTWVKNNIETEWYYGCMKGAEETLRQKSGNDCDQAALLVALLRSGKYPARYVRGVIEFFPDLTLAKKITGIENPRDMAAFFQKAGIPYETVISGGEIKNIRFSHVWVEARVPYANYRGILIDEQGKTWLGLDTSIKNAGYSESTPEGLAAAMSLQAVPDEYLAAFREETPMEFLRSNVNASLTSSHPETSYDDLLLTRVLSPDTMKILPATLQFTQTAITGEYTTLPDDLMHKAKFKATTAAGTTLFDLTLPVYGLSNQKIAIWFEPETVEDQEIINSFGGFGNTPPYLVRLRPVLKVGDDRSAVSTDGLAVGDTFDLSITLTSPNGSQAVQNTLVTGNLAVMRIASGQAAPVGAGERGTAVDILYSAAGEYISECNDAEDEIASLLQVKLTRPAPTLVTLGGVVETSRLFGTSFGFEWKGVYLDADFRAVSLVGGVAFVDNTDPKKLFMRLSSLSGSALESSVLKETFNVDGVSTASVLSRIGESTLLTVTSDTIDTVLPTLSVSDAIAEDIQNAVNQGFTVKIPAEEITIEEWTGIGYLNENPETGEAGWMLSGEIAGGMTAWSADRWDAYYRSLLENPFGEPADQDPTTGNFIQKISATDLQKGTAGEALPRKLQVKVTDKKHQPVSGARVTFSMKAGGGAFAGGGVSFTTASNSQGIAEASVILGKKTSDNPTFLNDGSGPNLQRVGENIIDACLSKGVSLKTPFTAYGFPGDPVQINKTAGDGATGSVLNWAGLLSVLVVDQYGNPVSNIPVTFTVMPPVENSTCANANQDTRPALLFTTKDPCADSIPSYGDCGSASDTRTSVSTSNGAGIQAILGGVPDADYPISVMAGDIETTLTLHTRPFGNCTGVADPAKQMGITTFFQSDGTGKNISAVAPGGKIPLSAKLSWLVEGETEIEGTLTCGGTKKPCIKVAGNRLYDTDVDLTSSSVSFGGTSGASKGAGLFTVEYPVAAGVNTVSISGTGKIRARVNHSECPECKIENEEVTLTAYATATVYGVTVETEPKLIVPVDAEGYAGYGITIPYTITPAEYKAFSAQVEILKAGTPIVYIPGELQGNGTVTIAKGFLFDMGSQYTARVILNNGNQSEIRSKVIPITPVKAQLTPDWNRDGAIDGKDSSGMATGKPWRFWVNNDLDKYADEDGTNAGMLTECDLPLQDQYLATDKSDSVVNSVRDLVDFFPLFVDIKNAMTEYPAEEYTYRLKQSDDALAGFETDMVPGAAIKYLQNLTETDKYKNMAVTTINADGSFVLTEPFLNKIKDGGEGILLLECREATTNPLVLEVVKKTDSKVVLSLNMPLSVTGVEDMFRHKDLRNAATGNQDAPNDKPTISNHPDSMDQDFYFVWVHGYRVDATAARATYSEVFKRLFWSGFKGKFYPVSWFGDADGLIAHYHNSVINAFATSDELAAFVKTLGDNVYIAGHSLGNMVISAAINDYGLTCKKYFAIDAAVALEAYNEAEIKNDSMVPVGNDIFLTNWNNYGDPWDKLWASEWHTLFEGTEDHRKELTWRDRFKHLWDAGKPQVYNFYSSTEDVLRKYEGNNYFEGLGTYGWVKQEKFKGKSSAFETLGGATSDYCGWGYNLSEMAGVGSGLYYKTITVDGQEITVMKSKDELGNINSLDLIHHPFFKKNPQELFEDTGSDFVNSKVDEQPVIRNEYEVLGEVKVRDWLLAKAFPALSLPVGANENSLLGYGNNLDLSDDIFKTDPGRWPNTRNEKINNIDVKSWWHGDYKAIAYQHVYKFYNKLVELSEH